MEEYHIDTVTSDKDSIFILYSHVTAWNDNLMLPLYRTDNDITKFFTKIRNGHLAKTAGGLDDKFHEANASTSKAFDRQGVGEVNDIRDSAGSQELRINDKRKTENILFLEIRVRIFRVPHPNDSFFSSHFLG
ncbi:Uncharacterised protein [Streptococcus pneumoniae]|nr:Uncharacterised protein [Streptococcus pneumoniae]CJG70657.1 Uncharacterised protein [Streptococcus pneumoniae]